MEMTIIIAFAAVVVIFFLFKLLTPSKPKKNLLPEPWRIPIIGHMHHLIGTIPHQGITELARKYGPLMHLQLGEVSTVVVSSPRWAKEILTTYDINLAYRPETLTGEIVAYHNSDIVFAPYGEYWRQLRKICTLELLNTKKVKSFQSLREEECWSLVNEIKASGSGKPIDLSKCVSNLIARIISRSTFGKGIKDEIAFREIVRETIQLTGGFDIADVFPSKKILHHLSGKRAKLTKIHNKLDTLINNIISDHPGSHLSSSQESFLDVVLRHKDDVEFPLTSDNVKAVIFDMFGAGTDTSSTVIEWAISELIKYPRVMEKLQSKLRDVGFESRWVQKGEIVVYHNSDIVLALYGEYWRQLRKICTLELLNTKKVKSFQWLREEECWSLVNEIKASGSGKPIDLSKCVSNLIVRIISRSTFRKGIKDEIAFRETTRETGQLTGGFDIADVFPSKKILHHLSGKRAKLTKIHNKLDTLMNNIISDHHGSHLSSSQESFLDVLLRHKDDAEFPLTSDNVKAVIFDMFGAGTDTSSTVIEWAISELIKCPRVMEKLQAKLREAIKDNERIQEEDIQEVMYLKYVIKETLRLHPPLPLLIPRECREPCVIDGYDIPIKTKLLVNVYAINRDPEYWKDPESFIPERFENSPINIMGSEYEYLPFDGGRRRCPGASMGLANIELPLANLLYYFNWKLPDGASHDELDMSELFGVNVQRKTNLVLVPTFQDIVDGSGQ